ncbi:MAG: homoserine dehydrogenase [Candidatus Omnitrophota bacterium]|jgi:homoserine dehydrogenase
MNIKKINIGIIGLGTVGGGVARILKEKRKKILSESGIDFCIKTVCVKNTRKKRKISLKGIQVTNNPEVIWNDPSIDQVLELMGGTTQALEIVQKSFLNGKDVITANKALLAEKSNIVFEAMRKSKRQLGFEAAVAGGIPIVRGMLQGLIANDTLRILGILNGTCNYILSEMTAKGLSFAAVLADAQAKGYAEANPALDIKGVDAAHKLAILARLAFGLSVDFKSIYCEGIEHISAEDIRYAESMGYAIKLLAIAKKHSLNSVELRVHPVLIHKSHLLANVQGVNNAALITTDETGDVLFYGRGAGEGPTASAVISDMIAIASTPTESTNTLHNKANKATVTRIRDIRSRYYIRFQVVDRPGVMGMIARELGNHGVSLSSVSQEEVHGKNVPVIILTHEASEKDIQSALKKIVLSKDIKKKPVSIRIEDEV